ncbi:hypothetical protein, partial [Halorubrum sp. C191]|uniref:hypothetical protein n=1 Tax=Halorubrum sp. C191 TaxID=1383842 RepID=UPI001A7E0AAB
PTWRQRRFHRQTSESVTSRALSRSTTNDVRILCGQCVRKRSSRELVPVLDGRDEVEGLDELNCILVAML